MQYKFEFEGFRVEYKDFPAIHHRAAVQVFIRAARDAGFFVFGDSYLSFSSWRSADRIEVKEEEEDAPKQA